MNEEVKCTWTRPKNKCKMHWSTSKMNWRKSEPAKQTPKILNDVLVDYYGSPTPLSQVANITAPDPRTIAVQPLGKKNMLGPIQKPL